MTELFLKKEGGDWLQVYFSNSGNGFKLTRENPYFTQAESYTLEVALPADILQNRDALGSIHRMDTTKRPPVYKCRLMVNSVLMLDGAAHVTQVNEKEVKIQLVGGNSEVNFMAQSNEDYIDQIPIGTRRRIEGSIAYSDISTGLPFSYSAIYNETKGEYSRILTDCHPQLVGVMRRILQHYGFQMKDCFIDHEPWDKLYIASALHTLDIAHKLPHWTVPEFIREFSHFFNATPVIDQIQKTVLFVSNSNFYGPEAQAITLNPVDEYTAELTEEDNHEILANANIAFDLSGSPCHDYDCFTDEQRKGLPRLSFNSAEALRSAYDSMDSEQRRKSIFSSQDKDYITWKLTDTRGENEYEERVNADFLKPLDRGADKTVTLKIVPVAIGHEAVECINNDTGEIKRYHGIPSIESPTPDEEPAPWKDEQENVIFPDIQDVIQGAADIATQQKEDRMQVMFDDNKTFDHPEFIQFFKFGFIDFGHKQQTGKINNPWSLSFYPTQQAFASFLGSLHQNSFTFNVRAKTVFHFIADAMPDPTRVYYIKGKRYACEKFEANVDAEGLDRLMTGYFYEIL